MYREMEEVSGEFKLTLRKGENAASKYDEFLNSTREKYKKRGKSIDSLEVETIDENSNRVIFKYKAKIYDYDFNEADRFWTEYETMLKRGTYEL